MRLISFFLTRQAFIERRKTVTRRKGWLFLKKNDHLMGATKCQGLKLGQKIERLGEIVVVSPTRERMDEIIRRPIRETGIPEVVLEGLPDITPGEYVDMMADQTGLGPDDLITRIEYDYATPEPPDHIWVRSGRRKVIHYLLQPDWAVCGRLLKARGPMIPNPDLNDPDICPYCRERYLNQLKLIVENAPHDTDQNDPVQQDRA